jgi:hypothetical protein
MPRVALSLLLMFAVSPLFADVAPAAERAEVRRTLLAAAGRYDAVPAGLRWESLTVDGKILARARVHSADTWNATIFYDTGMKRVPLAKLPAEAQRLLGFDPARPPAPPVTAPVASAAPVLGKPKAPVNVIWSGDPVARVLMAYGERPYLRKEVDLRPEYDRLGLSAKDQGESPSCSVFAVVSALEYHLAQGGRLNGRLSEDFVQWATMRSLGKTKDRLEFFGNEARFSDGFAIIEVTQALRCYGAPLKVAMPSAFDPGADIPPESAQREALSRCQLGSVAISGRSRREQLEQVVLALNEGLPVVIGMRWPKMTREFQITGNVPEDTTGGISGGHAVVLVGYSCPDGDMENAVFRFRNSYGVKWGDKGYGTVSWKYLVEHFTNGMFLDLR